MSLIKVNVEPEKVHLKSSSQTLDPAVATILRRQKYQIIGGHSAVKKCRWLHKSLTAGEPCYKEKFYGIRSHRCLQVTPAVVWCTQRCLYCWRIQEGESHLSSSLESPASWDSPADLAVQSIVAQRRILSGYKGQVAEGRVDPKKYSEAMEPKHAAISLTGEPTIYPFLDGLISEYHRLGLTTFLVTNGTRPEALANLKEEPTQIYISLSAPNLERYIHICRPTSPGCWQGILETLELLKSFSCPTAVRITLVKGYNMQDLQDYARLILRAEPTYIEPKAYMYVGYSRRRLQFSNMPSHKEVHEFALRLADYTGYKIIDESVDSRVALLSRLERPISIM
ncbi:MAG: 4-demethylwyosine synthase TYW1 [Candidatus Bathyarchaeia archaeon]